MKIFVLALTTVLMVLSNSAHALTFDTMTMRTPPHSNAEILDYDPSRNLLVTNDTVNSLVRFYSLNASDPNKILDITPLPTTIKTSGEPTSVALWPDKPYGFAAILDDEPKQNGTIIAYSTNDLNDQLSVSFKTEIGPDCIDISPDGKWLLVANEAQGSDQTKGSISFAKLDADEPTTLPCIQLRILDGLAELTGLEPGKIEPEFIAFDPQSRFAAVTCQENDLVVIVDLSGDTPTLDGMIELPECAEPDGVSILDNIKGSDEKIGCLIGIAEEGRKDNTGTRKGQTVSFYWIDPSDLSGATLCCRLDVRNVMNINPNTRCDPEGIVIARIHTQPLAFVGIERQNCVLCLDLTSISQPKLLHTIPTGPRPEGLILIEQQDTHYLITANESTNSQGSITVCRVR